MVGGYLYQFMLVAAVLCFISGSFTCRSFIRGRADAAEGSIIGKSFLSRSFTKLCVLIYTVFCSVSAVLSEYGSKVWLGAGRHEGLSTVLLYTAVFLLVSCFGRLRKRHLILIGAAVTINAVIGILQYFGYNPFYLYPRGYTYHDAFTLYANAFLGTLGNIDILSAFLCLMLPLLFAYYLLNEKSGLLLIPFTAGFFLLLISGVSAGFVGIGAGIIISVPAIANSRRGFIKALRAGGLVLFCAAVYFSLSVTYENRITDAFLKFGVLSAALSFLAAAMFALSVFLSRSRTAAGWDERKARRILIICMTAAAAAFFATVWIYPFSGGVLSEMHRVLHNDIDSSFGSSRIQIWRLTAELIPERFWFGGGPDTLAERITFTFQRFNEATGTMIKAFIDNAHNDYLNILANTGAFSLAAYLAALISAAVRTLRAGLKNRASAAVFIALLCYLIQMFFGFSICIVSPFFWILFGLLDAAPRENTRKETGCGNLSFKYNPLNPLRKYH